MVVQLARQGFALMDARERAEFWRLLALMVFMALFDTIGVAAILPFLAILAEPQSIHSNHLLAGVYGALGYTNEFKFLSTFGLVVFAIIVTGQFLKAYGSYKMVQFGKGKEVTLGTRLLASYLARPYVFFTQKNSGQLSKEILSEVSLVSDGMFLPTLKVMSTAIVFLFLTGLLILVDPWATMLAALFVGGCYGLIFYLSQSLLERIGSSRYSANERRFRAVHEALGSIKELKLHAREAVYIRKFSSSAATFARVQALAIAVSELPRYLLEAIVFGGMMAFLLLLLQSEGGDIKGILPTIGVFGLAGTKMFPAVQTLYANLSVVNVNAPALRELLNQLGEDGQALDLDAARAERDPSGPNLPAPTRQIELARVAFSYPDARRAAVLDLNLVIPVNSTVGIVGSTGAGKTTAMDVLLGLLTPDDGDLRVDGRPITPATLAAWQRHVGYVPQQLYILDDTVAVNIAFGVPNEEINFARVRHAAALAGIDSFISEDLAQGYDTLLGDRGSKLSGGQRQRIGIARALYKDPAVLVFDEATSSLDNLSERAVIDAIHRLRSQKTIIMVAHRLSTVRHCDQIVLIDGGAAYERGTYDELVHRGGKFTSLAKATA